MLLNPVLYPRGVRGPLPRPDDLRIVWPAPFFLATACGPLGLGDLRIAGPFLFLGE